jgi:hypothetical protein
VAKHRTGLGQLLSLNTYTSKASSSATGESAPLSGGPHYPERYTGRPTHFHYRDQIDLLPFPDGLGPMPAARVHRRLGAASSLLVATVALSSA